MPGYSSDGFKTCYMALKTRRWAGCSLNNNLFASLFSFENCIKRFVRDEENNLISHVLYERNARVSTRSITLIESSSYLPFQLIIASPPPTQQRSEFYNVYHPKFSCAARTHK